MRSKYPVENESLFQELCENRGLSESTIILYGLSLQKYSDFTNKTLEELIDEADLEEDEGIRLRKRKIKKYLIEFKTYLVEEEGYSQNYVKNLLAMVKSFYSEYEIQLPRTFKRKTRKDKKHEVYEDLPTMEEIKRALNYANSAYKAIILVGLSSGMSRAELCSLTFKNFYDGISFEKYPKSIGELLDRVMDLSNITPIWNIKRIKTGKPYFTFSSPEASDAIIEYLEELNRKYPNYVPLPEDTFFRTHNLPVTQASITAMFRRINKRAGFRKVNNRQLVRPHTLRKLFATTLEKNKMPHLMTRWLMGHRLDTTTSAYFKADPVALKEEYIQIVNHLTINQEINVKTVQSAEYTELKEENVGLRI